VLASVGVVERRHAPAGAFPGSSHDRLELLEAEDTIGNAIALATTLTENLCTWWIGTVRERILARSCRRPLVDPLTGADVPISPCPHLCPSRGL